MSNTRCAIFFFSLLLVACNNSPESTAVTTRTSTDSVVRSPALQANADSDLNFARNEAPEEAPPLTPPVKRPTGIYRFTLPNEGGHTIRHTIQFTPGNFRLQEEFNDSDSAVFTEGTWAPSAGFIWLYRDQVVRGRYTWSGDTLQYYSPRLKKAFSMEKLSPVAANEVWKDKKQQGSFLYAVGTEPFWSLELISQDSVVINMPDWTTPLRAKLSAINATADSTTFVALQDSLQFTVYPFFCSDGMSDFAYTRKVKLVYRGQTYSGCGERLRK